MTLFNLSALFDESAKQDKSAVASQRYEAIHIEKVNSLKQLIGRVPDKGEIFFLWTLNSFNAFTFITYIIRHIGPIEQLIFSTYSINERILCSLIRWYDKGAIRDIHICISDSIKTRVPKVNDQLQSFARDRNISISYAWNHSKVTLIKVETHHFVICGSGNFSENALNEQYIFLDDEHIYNFYADCIKNRAY